MLHLKRQLHCFGCLIAFAFLVFYARNCCAVTCRSDVCSVTVTNNGRDYILNNIASVTIIPARPATPPETPLKPPILAPPPSVVTPPAPLPETPLKPPILMPPPSVVT